MVIGLFEGPDKSKWVMLVNRDPRKVAQAKVTFASPQKISEVDKISGKLRPLGVNAQAVDTFSFKQGEGRLFLLTPQP
jgi:hypothetical protein